MGSMTSASRFNVRFNNIKWRETVPLAILGAVFSLSRFIYYQAGLRFESGTITSSWHFIDIHLLETDLWRSMFYLHTQPPLLNLFTGLGLQLFPSTYHNVFNLFFLLTGLTLSISIYLLGIRLGFPRYLSLIIAVGFSISPATVVYENWYSYAYPLTTLLTLSAVFLARFLENRRPVDGLLFSLLLAAMALTWSLFHLIWLVGCFSIAWLGLRGNRRKAFWLLPALLLVISWYAKNQVLYDSFSASTWGGLNLFKIVTYEIPGEARKRWIKQGKVSELALVPPFRSPEVYLKYFPDTPLTGIPLLDEHYTFNGYRNQHHRVYVPAGERYWKDSFRLIALAPYSYLHSIQRSSYIFFHSATDYKQVTGIRLPVNEMDTLWNRVFYGQWQKDESLAERAERFSPANLAWSIFIGFLIAIVGGCACLWYLRARLDPSCFALLVFLLWNLLYVSAIAVTMDIGENNRFRYTIDPLALLMFVFVIRNLRAAFSRLFGLFFPNA